MTLHQRLTLLSQNLAAAFLSVLSAPLRLLPRKAALGFGAALGDMGSLVAPKLRDRARFNLVLAYGDTLDAAGRDRIVRGVFRHFGRMVVDIVRSRHLSPNQVEALLTVEGWEHVDRAYRAGKGIIIVTGHIGNWELFGRWVAQIKKIPLTAVAREPRSPALAEFMREMRNTSGFEALNKGESARTLLRILKRGEAITVLPDQNSGDVFVPFFGVPAGTPAGPATLALRTGAAILPMYCVLKPDGTYRGICFPPIPATDTGDKNADVARIMAALNEVLESVIRQYPDQWLWLHNRWKSAFEEKNRERAWPPGGPPYPGDNALSPPIR